MLNYFGGKWNAGEWIISLFPEHDIYCEPFGGGASVLLQKPRSKREIINDLDGEIVNLYRVMRDHFSALERLLKLTPHSRKEYLNAYEPSKRSIEQARRTIIKSYFGIGDSQFHKGNGMRTSKTSNTCVATSWKNYSDCAHEISDRFRGVTIECLDYREVIQKYDSPSTLFYLDPPYVLSLRNGRHAYRHDFGDEDQTEFLKAIKEIQGMAIVSGYENDLYKSLGWETKQQEARTQGAATKTETVWLSPSAILNQSQMRMAL